jgi:hypothetical protein
MYSWSPGRTQYLAMALHTSSNSDSPSRASGVLALMGVVSSVVGVVAQVAPGIRV